MNIHLKIKLTHRLSQLTCSICFHVKIHRFLMMAVKFLQLYLFVYCFCCSAHVESTRRKKREIRFPKGTTLSLTVALSSHFPSGPLSGGIAHLLEFDLAFPLPDEVVYHETTEKIKKDDLPGAIKYKNEFASRIKKHRTKRNSIKKAQRELLLKLEKAITRLGYDGSACISRFRCELNNVSPENSVIEEILVALFKISNSSNTEKCQQSISQCPISLLHILLHSEQVFNTL